MKKKFEESVEWLSPEMHRIANIPRAKWKMAILNSISKILNVKQEFPYRWHYEGKKLETGFRNHLPEKSNKAKSSE